MTTNERFFQLLTKFQSLGWYATSLVTLLLLAALLGVGWVYQKAAFENQLAVLNQQIAKLDDKLSNQIVKLDENLSEQITAIDSKQTQTTTELSEQIAAVNNKHSQAIAELSKVHDNLSNQIAAVDEKHSQVDDNLSTQIATIDDNLSEVDNKHSQAAAELSKVHDNLSIQIAAVNEKHSQAAAELSKVDDDLSTQIATVDEKHTKAAAELSKVDDNLSTQIAAVDEKHSQAFAQLVASKKVDEPSSKSDDNTVWLSDKVFQDRLKDGSLGPKMAMLPSNTFRMGDIQGGGSSNEQPVHDVRVDGFAMGQYEVTVAEFRRFVNATGYQTDAEKGDGCYAYDGSNWNKRKDANWRNVYFSQNDSHPVVCVSWNDAKAYTDWLSEQTGHVYRLPTEAQWEYAARAGTTTQYWWGNEVGTNNANCYNCGTRWDRKSTAEVGSFAANPFGLYDTAGNVWEWTCSQYESGYRGKEQQCADSAGRFVYLGGGWNSLAARTRSAGVPPYFNVDCGFRPARIK